MQLKKFLFYISLSAFATSCFKETSSTGWEYNNPHNGGFQKVPYLDQETPPDMVLVEGRIIPFSLENEEADTLNNFYISKYEETNGQYLAYVQYIKKYYSDATYKSVLPDTTVWRNEDFTQEEKDILVNNYFRDPLYKNFPVVGVSPKQIERYAWWKTDRINEFILVREGLFNYPDWMKDSSDVFTTIGYLRDTYHPSAKETRLIDLDPKGGWNGKRSDISQRIVRLEDGILLPRYRMCSEEEWLWAAQAVGDDKYAYLRTQKDMNVKKYDKESHYTFLYSIELKKDQTIYFSSAIEGIGNVYDHTTNNYLITGMANGVSEIVQVDSSSFSSVGGSWKVYADHSAIYYVDSTKTGRYKFPWTHDTFDSIKSDSVGAIGFRLAMNRYGYPDGISTYHSVSAENRFYSKRRRGID